MRNSAVSARYGKSRRAGETLARFEHPVIADMLARVVGGAPVDEPFVE